MDKEQAIAAAKTADITNINWADNLVDELDSFYARGYLQAKMEELGNSMCPDDEDYRHEIIEYLNYDIYK